MAMSSIAAAPVSVVSQPAAGRPVRGGGRGRCAFGHRGDRPMHRALVRPRRALSFVPPARPRAHGGAVTPVRIIGAVSLMSCVGYFVAMCILSPLGRERQMAMSSIAAAPVSVVLNLLLDGPFGAAGAGVALLATEATVLRIELLCARDVLSSLVRPRDLARMAASNVIAVAVSAGCAWLLATAFSSVPERSQSRVCWSTAP